MPSSGHSLPSTYQILCNISILNKVVGIWWDSRWRGCWIVENLIIEPYVVLGCWLSITIPNIVINVQIMVKNRNSRLKPSAIFDFRKPDFWPVGLNRQLFFHLCTKFGAKMLVDAQVMAQNRNLGILISPHRTTHEVFSLGYISLSNFVLIRYIVLKILGFDFFAELVWNAYLRPQISFWAMCASINISHQIWYGDGKSAAQIDPLVKNQVFENPRWRMAAILIWQEGANLAGGGPFLSAKFHSDHFRDVGLRPLSLEN